VGRGRGRGAGGCWGRTGGEVAGVAGEGVLRGAEGVAAGERGERRASWAGSSGRLGVGLGPLVSGRISWRAGRLIGQSLLGRRLTSWPVG